MSATIEKDNFTTLERKGVITHLSGSFPYVYRPKDMVDISDINGFKIQKKAVIDTVIHTSGTEFIDDDKIKKLNNDWDRLRNNIIETTQAGRITPAIKRTCTSFEPILLTDDEGEVCFSE